MHPPLLSVRILLPQPHLGATGELEVLVLMIVATILLLVVVAAWLVARRLKRELADRIGKTDAFVRKKLIETEIRAKEAERKRIARNLHDEIASELSMIRFNLSCRVAKLRQSTEAQALGEELLNLGTVIDKLRGTCHDLFPETLQHTGLIQTLRWWGDRVSSSSTIRFESVLNLNESDVKLDMEKKLHCLRLHQELFTNILKYASCNAIRYTASGTDGRMEFLIEHNGRPFTNEDARRELTSSAGTGLSSIYTRLEMLGGRVDFRSLGQKGSAVLLTIPYSNERDN